MTGFSDETVMAYVDGELDDATSALIEAALETDSELGARLELFAQTRLAAQDALRPLLAEPVPAHLQAAVAGMVAGATAKKPFTVPEPANDWWRIAAAACIAAIVGGVGGWMISGPSGQQARLQLAGVDQDALAGALASVPSGQELLLADGTTLRTKATFRDGRETLCREFEVAGGDARTIASVACKDGAAWVVRLAIDLPSDGAGSGAYAPASAPDVLDAFLSSVGAGEPLTGADERAALQSSSKARE